MRGRKPKRISHPTAYQFYDYHLGELFTPGAEGEVFLPRTNNPLYSFRGPARLAGTLEVFQPPQVSVPPFSIPVNGIPTTAGQYILQPLVPTPDGSSGN